jgi:hypothetical protein
LDTKIKKENFSAAGNLKREKYASNDAGALGEKHGQ